MPLRSCLIPTLFGFYRREYGFGTIISYRYTYNFGIIMGLFECPCLLFYTKNSSSLLINIRFLFLSLSLSLFLSLSRSLANSEELKIIEKFVVNVLLRFLFTILSFITNQTEYKRCPLLGLLQ